MKNCSREATEFVEYRNAGGRSHSVRAALLFFFHEIHGWTDLQLDKASAPGSPEFGRGGRFWRRRRRFFWAVGLNIHDCDVWGWDIGGHRPDSSPSHATNARQAGFRHSALNAGHPKSMHAASRRSSGRADGYTTAGLRRDGERDQNQERGDQECHKDTDCSPISLSPGGGYRQGGGNCLCHQWNAMGGTHID